MKRLAWKLGLVVVVAVGGPVQAEGLIEKVTSWRRSDGKEPGLPQKIRGIASPNEVAYAKVLHAALGDPSAKAPYPARIGHGFRPASDPSRSLTARGVRVAIPGGPVVERLMLESERAAFEYALYAANFGEGKDVLVEARGRQVVIVRGSELGGAERASTIFDAAWGTLPAPDTPPSISATALVDRGRMVVTRLKDPVLTAEIQESYAHMAAKVRDGSKEFAPSDGGYTWRMDNGWNGRMEAAAGVEVLVVAANDELRQQLERQQQRAMHALGVTPPEPLKPAAPAKAPERPQREQDGARGRLQRAFGD